MTLFVYLEDKHLLNITIDSMKEIWKKDEKMDKEKWSLKQMKFLKETSKMDFDMAME